MSDRRVLANAIRALSMDAVQKANSGHPGAPMGMADMAEVLWNDFLKHNPGNPAWFDRDRFVLSNGHASMLLYSVLHLSGYDLTIEDIKNFRQLGSRTPGHPEVGEAPGVETTTGPLGQGLANAVGMALAEKILAARFNKPGLDIVGHHTYAFAGDGCLMEGISHEACSLAGTLGLGKLIVLYDDNGISIDGRVSGWFTDDTPARFAAYGWHVVKDVDGHDADSIRRGIEQAREVLDRPSLICCKTIIGYGAPSKCDNAGCHGSPLGPEEISAARERLAWPHEPFQVPGEVYAAWNARDKGAKAETAWNTKFAEYEKKYPGEAREFVRRMRGDLPEDWAAQADEAEQAMAALTEPTATRKLSGKAIEFFARNLPEMIGGSADLTGSVNTVWSKTRPVTPEDPDGNYIYYGVREFAMAAIMNGMALHGGFIPYAGTFLVFSDYMRNAMRMSALMGRRCIYVLTHDSIGVGEDGPTHQPVEHAASLRLIPNMTVWRPANAVETGTAWRSALEKSSGPTSLVLTRQKLPVPEAPIRPEDAARGGYIYQDCDGEPEAIIIASGSEVGLAVEAARTLASKGRRVRVVSMPSTDVFDAQDAAWREKVLPHGVSAKVAVEAGVTSAWYKYAHAVVGMDRFGASAPGSELFRHFEITPKAVVKAVEDLL